jgi:hypothetical protein
LHVQKLSQKYTKIHEIFVSSFFMCVQLDSICTLWFYFTYHFWGSGWWAIKAIELLVTVKLFSSYNASVWSELISCVCTYSFNDECLLYLILSFFLNFFCRWVVLVEQRQQQQLNKITTTTCTSKVSKQIIHLLLHPHAL